jgi:hypothetical protein
MTPFSAPRSAPGLVLLVLLGLVLAGCERGFPVPASESTISEDQFVAAMAAILSEAPAHQDSRLPEEERDHILREMGLEPGDLVTFAEVHGTDVTYMLSVWTRVDSAFLAAMSEAATEPGGEDAPGAPNPGAAPPGAVLPWGPGSGDGPGR